MGGRDGGRRGDREEGGGDGAVLQLQLLFCLQGSGPNFRQGCKGVLLAPRSRWPVTTRSLPRGGGGGGGGGEEERRGGHSGPLQGFETVTLWWGIHYHQTERCLSVLLARQGSALGQLFFRCLLCRLSTFLFSPAFRTYSTYFFDYSRNKKRREKLEEVRMCIYIYKYMYVYIYLEGKGMN